VIFNLLYSIIMKKVPLILVLSMLSLGFAQEGAIKFQISLDSTGMLIPAPPRTAPPPVAPPPKAASPTAAPAPAAPQPAAVPAPTAAPVVAPSKAATPPAKQPEVQPQKTALSSSKSQILNLAELSVKDTASFETYSWRRALVQDSIAAMQREIENSKKRTSSQFPPLEPKGEYEKQAEFDARRDKRDRELGERMLRDYKPYSDRLAELERAKKKIEDNQSSLYCTVEIKTNPAQASIFLNKDEIGASPIEYNIALPGLTVISVQKEKYEPWDTTLTLQPAQKIKLNLTLQEKSIFSKEGEINFQKIIARDTTVRGYRLRMNRVKARIKQIDSEIKVILEDFGRTYPPLEPKRPDETMQDFERRQTTWREDGIRQAGLLRYKHEAYTNQLVRTLNVLENNIIATESQLIAETPANAQITLGAYDVEREIFELDIQDTTNAKTPFHFVGIVGIPRDTAKAMNRSTDGFLIGINFLNYPFVYKDSSYNLAMKGLSLSRKATSLRVNGSFKPISKFEFMEGYMVPWRSHADSLLGGELKVNSCLDLDYIMGKKGCGKSTDVAAPTSPILPVQNLGWRGWTRIGTFTAAAIFGAVAVKKQMDVLHYADEANAIKPNLPPMPDPASNDYISWYDDSNVAEHRTHTENYNKSLSSRNIFGAFAGVFALGGILTFVF